MTKTEQIKKIRIKIAKNKAKAKEVEGSRKYSDNVGRLADKNRTLASRFKHKLHMCIYDKVTDKTDEEIAYLFRKGQKHGKLYAFHKGRSDNNTSKYRSYGYANNRLEEEIEKLQGTYVSKGGKNNFIKGL